MHFEAKPRNAASRGAAWRRKPLARLRVYSASIAGGPLALGFRSARCISRQTSKCRFARRRLAPGTAGAASGIIALTPRLATWLPCARSRGNVNSCGRRGFLSITVPGSVFEEGNGKTMVFGLFRQKASARVAPLYEGLMRASRQPAFYAGLGVADSVEGRLEMLMLHVGLAVHRLSREAAGRETARHLSEVFIDDMERSLREIGYDDSGLKRRLKKVVGAFYGRAEATAAALGSDRPAALADTLARNIYGGAADPRHVACLADYVRGFAQRLDDTSVDELVAGALPSLMPSSIPAGEPAIPDLEP
ncbi:ubiquinol-cytochrome C chaperone family protein [uncultured Pleomorphomonas sp.]|nr:ubiquinol-cytochrome C chaperone family protein [uncultured Pleomorphomonas sp.]